MTSSSEQQWTPLKVIDFSVDYLKARGVPEPRLDAELMLAHVLGWTRIDLYTRFEQPLKADDLSTFREMLKKRGQRIPVKYLLGKTEFMSMEFKVTPAVLIPRPETEHLVERAIEHLKSLDASEPRLLDAGTGSGIVACSVAKHVEAARVVATDISPEALQVARENAEAIGVADRIAFAEADMMQQLAPPDHPGPYHIIASNPPYIAPHERADLEPEVAEHEPGVALFSDDALAPTRSILEQAPPLLADGGLVLIEIAFDAAEAVRASIDEVEGLVAEAFIMDYGDRPRVAVARKAGD
jgi:release factor glutamine methyltransferase